MTPEDARKALAERGLAAASRQLEEEVTAEAAVLYRRLQQWMKEQIAEEGGETFQPYRLLGMMVATTMTAMNCDFSIRRCGMPPPGTDEMEALILATQAHLTKGKPPC